MKPDEDYIPGKTFSDFHPDYVSVFNLSREELQVVGDWLPREGYQGYVVNYYLGPNHRAFMSAGLSVRGSDRKLGYLDGTWEIREGVLYVKVFVLGYQTEDKQGLHGFPQMAIPFEQAIIRVQDIHPDGYSLRPLAQIKLPQDVEGSLQQSPDYSPNYMYRSLGSNDNISGGYRYLFNDLEFLARHRDAGVIFTSLSNYETYMAELRAYHKNNP